MADNTWQADWIMLVAGELRGILPGHFVAADLFWYPVRGRPDLCKAPDVMVVLGRPPGGRPSYRQWQENDVAPAVIFEFASQNNTEAELCEEKRDFYQLHGAREYYVYDPQPAPHSRTPFRLRAWQRRGERLDEVVLPPGGGWCSPLLGVTFAREDNVPDGELRLLRPDGTPFRNHQQVLAGEGQERARADRERARADQERARADAAEAKFAKLRALGIDPDTL